MEGSIGGICEKDDKNCVKRTEKRVVICDDKLMLDILIQNQKSLIHTMKFFFPDISLGSSNFFRHIRCESCFKTGDKYLMMPELMIRVSPAFV